MSAQVSPLLKLYLRSSSPLVPMCAALRCLCKPAPYTSLQCDSTAYGQVMLGWNNSTIWWHCVSGGTVWPSQDQWCCVCHCMHTMSIASGMCACCHAYLCNDLALESVPSYKTADTKATRAANHMLCVSKLHNLPARKTTSNQADVAVRRS